MVSKDYCKRMPKIELHAHLNGSLSENTLRQLGCLNEEVQEYNSLTKILQKTERTLDECFNLFKVAHQVTGNIENLYLATLNVIKEFHEDGVLYLELRTTPRSENNMTKRQYIETVIKAIRNNKYDIVVKLILSIDRRHVDEISYESLNLIIKMKQIHPDVIVGVDLCGNPNEGKFDCKLFQEARENNLKITLHCAEVKNDLETIEILNFKPDRIGHGTCIHPDFKGAKELWDNYLKTKIPIEMCLTSNVICGTSNSYKEHHIKNWYEKSLPLAICTDDKGVFSTSLSHEYHNFAESFDIPQGTLYEIAYKTIDYAFITDEEKDKLKKTFNNFTK